MNNKKKIKYLKYLDKMENIAYEIEKIYFKNFHEVMAIIGFLILKLKLNAPKDIDIFKNLKGFVKAIEELNKKIDKDILNNKIIPFNKDLLFKNLETKIKNNE